MNPRPKVSKPQKATKSRKPAVTGRENLYPPGPAPVIDLASVRTLQRHYADAPLSWAIRLSTSSGRERVG
jgi:hypothetical protein